MPQPTYLSKGGLEKLQAELEHLQSVVRRRVADKIQQSRERGGSTGDAEGRILTLENLVNNAVIIDEADGKKDTVEVGATVTVKNPDGKNSSTSSPAALKQTRPRARFPTYPP